MTANQITELRKEIESSACLYLEVEISQQLKRDRLVMLLQQECAATNQRSVAKRLKITDQYLSDILHGRRKLSESVIGAISGFGSRK